MEEEKIVDAEVIETTEEVVEEVVSEDSEVVE